MRASSRVTALATLALLALAPRAHAQIFQPGTQPAGHDGGLEVPIQSSSTCRNCHGRFDAADDYEPWDSWRGAMMANAGRDPVFRAALAIAEEDHPDAADFCVRCHSLGAWLAGRSELPEWSTADGPRLAPDEAGFLSDDLDGVACMVCHRATDTVASDPDAPHLSNAQIHVLDGADAETRLGPYTYGAGEDPRHPTAQSAFLPRGDFCGQCHDIVSPLFGGRRLDGSETGRPFAIERTYSEWRASAFATRGETCQDCHMPEIEADVRVSSEGMPRSYARRHDLVGGSTWQPRAIAATIPDATGLVRGLIEGTAAEAEAMLARAARVEITSATVGASEATATVRVTNLTGHKLPTGYPEGRRMWLEVAIVDAAGDVVAGSGLYDDAAMQLVSDPQLHTYEIKLGQGTEPSFHFILNDTVLEDTRIPPEGFVPPETADILPVGRDYSDGAGGYRHWDEATFVLPACGTGDLTVRARLRYQSTTREYIEFLRDNAPDSLDPTIGNWGEIAYALWMEHGGGVPVDMAEATTTIAAPVACPDGGLPGEDGGANDGGASDAGRDAGDGGDDGGCGCAAPGSRSTDAPGSLVLVAIALFSAARRASRSRRRRARRTA